MNLKKVIKAKCSNCKHKNQNSINPKSSESFVWKDVNWRKIELRLNIIQHKIYVAKIGKDKKKLD
jgi:hypothetical protein